MSRIPQNVHPRMAEALERGGLEGLDVDLIIQLDTDGQSLIALPALGGGPGVSSDEKGNIRCTLEPKVGYTRTVLFWSIHPQLELLEFDARRSGDTPVPNTPFRFQVVKAGQGCLLIDTFSNYRSIGTFEYTMTYSIDGGPPQTWDPQILNEGTGGPLPAGGGD